MLYLRAFGGLSLENGGRPIGGAATQRSRLALLVLLAAAGSRGVSRDRLLALFWPDKDTERARAALRQALYALRRDADEPELVLGSTELALNRTVIGSDVLDFDEAVERGDLRRAVDLYAGALLDGVYLRDVPEFERWVDRERERRLRQYHEALERLANGASARGEFPDAVAFLTKLTASDPLSAAASVALMKSLVRADDHAAALRHAREYERRLRAELGVGPDASVVALAREIRGNLGTPPRREDAVRAEAVPPTAAQSETPDDRDHETIGEPQAPKRDGGRRGRSGPLMAAGGVALLVLGIALVGAVWGHTPLASSVEGSPVRSNIVLPDSAPLASVGETPNGRGSKLAISPDGKRLVYVAQRGTSTQLYLRELDRLDATPLAGTEGAQAPFFSPDGKWIAFFSGRDVKKVPVTGGPATTLATVSGESSGAWLHDGRILVAEKFGMRLSWLSSTGGRTTPIVPQLTARVLDLELVAGDKWILHSTIDGIVFLSSLQSGHSYPITLDGAPSRDSADESTLLHGSNPRYLKCGHIVYFSSDGVLMALPFDLERRAARGSPVPILQGIRLEAPGPLAQLTISSSGTLVYAPGSNGLRSVLGWLDYVTGRVDTLPFPEAGYRTLSLSPDGRRIVVQVDGSPSGPEWRVLDIDRATQMVVPTSVKPGVIVVPYWWPDNASIVFAEYTSPRLAPPRGVRQSLADPTNRVTMARVGNLSPDGRHVLLLPLAAGAITHNVNAASQPDTGRGIWLASIDGSERDIQLAAGEVAFPTFSPDGTWFVYTDRSSGQSEVYVARVSNPRERTKITAQRGDMARWTADGKMIMYVDGQQVYGVDVSTARGFVAGRPRLLFTAPFQQHANRSYDVSRDGRRFLLMLGPPDATPNPLIVVTNWFADIERLAPPRAK